VNGSTRFRGWARNCRIGRICLAVSTTANGLWCAVAAATVSRATGETGSTITTFNLLPTAANDAAADGSTVAQSGGAP